MVSQVEREILIVSSSRITAQYCIDGFCLVQYSGVLSSAPWRFAVLASRAHNITVSPAEAGSTPRMKARGVDGMGNADGEARKAQRIMKSGERGDSPPMTPGLCQGGASCRQK